MFKNVEIIKAVKGFAIQDNILYYLNNGQKLMSNNQVVCDAYGIESSEKALFTFQNMHDVETKVVFDKDKIVNTPYSLNADSFNGTNTIIYNKNFNDFENQVGLYEIFSEKIKWFSNIQRFGHNIRVGDLLFYNQTHTQLRSLSLLTGEYEWEIDLGGRLGEYDVIAKIIGVVDDVLWVISQRGILFGIAVHSGEVVHHINYDNVASHEEKGRVNAVYFYSLFDESNKKLIGIRDKVYWEIDLTDPENGLQKFDLVAANPAYFNDPSFVYRGIPWANPIGKIFDEDYIYFADIEIATVGVMNRQTKEIEWHTRLNDQEPRVRDVINDIRVSANKLYALDTGGTLHIFEKDNNQTV